MPENQILIVRHKSLLIFHAILEGFDKKNESGSAREASETVPAGS